MMKWIRRLGMLAVLCLALSQASIVFAQVTNPGQEPPAQDKIPNCRDCHMPIYFSWEESAHGQGLSCGQCHLADQNNHGRQGHGAQGGPGDCMACHTTGYNPRTDTWEEDNVHCIACHTPVPTSHPDEPMPTNRSVELCGRCHIQARFDWQLSEHGAAGVACVSCHSQHTTSLKSDSVIEQCAICHEQVTEEFTHNIHSENGLSCASCHLTHIDEPLGSGSAQLSHTFQVVVKTCVSCHKESLHDPSGSTLIMASNPGGGIEMPDAMASAVTVEVREEPEIVDRMSLVVLAGLAIVLGTGSLAFGGAVAWSYRPQLRSKNTTRDE
jgi:hypothetical protein